jgi:tRNA 5-methylaminomethyl-2-thiouridine biosynthesis bifunctional protein
VKTSPIVAAQVEWVDGVPFAPAFGDVYHARAGAFAQARDVFLAGNGLPARWRDRPRFTILETGFGLGNNFLATWAAWRDDPQRPDRLDFLSIEKHPLQRADLARALAGSPEPALAAELVAAWPPLVPGLHTLSLELGRVTLLLAFGDIATWLPELQASVDAIYLDGFAPARNTAMWDPHTLRALARLAAPGATAATWSAARVVREGLAGAGFCARRVPGFAGKREMTVAEVAPGAVERRHGPPAGRQAARQARSALVVGAGLAGAAAARALARQGLRVAVLDAADAPASAASGNPAGLFHGVVHAHDGAHAQWLRAAALRTAQVAGPLMAAGQVVGRADGLLRGTGDAPAAERAGGAAADALPADYVQWLPRDEAGAIAGCPLAGGAWHFPGGGWLQPRTLVQAWLNTPGIDLRLKAAVAALRPAEGGGWQAVDAGGRVLAEADVAVVAAARGTSALLAPHTDADHWPWRTTRGQVTLVPAADAASLPRPRRPVASGGYLIALPERLADEPGASLGGGLLCGATAQADDDDPAVRAADHEVNLAHLAALTGLDLAAALERLDRAGLRGRVGWRLGCDDRLPLIGGVPLPAHALAGAHRLDQPRHVPRVPGLYLLTALGSRGITWAALAGEVLAAAIIGAPLPVAASLVDAVDPARFIARRARQRVG